MATKTWIGAISGALASTDANWDTGTKPAAGDEAKFDGAFPVTGNDNCTWDLTTSINKFTTTSGYSGTITCSTAMNVNGGANNIFTHDGGTFDSNDKEITIGDFTNSSFDMSGSGTKTLTMGASAWHMYAGNWNASGSNTTVVAGTSSIEIRGAASTVTPGTHAWNSFLFVTATTKTISGTLTTTGTLDLDNLGSGVTFSGGTFDAQGNVTRGVDVPVTGDTVLQFGGGANQSFTPGVSNLDLPIVINKSANTLTFPNSVVFLRGNFTYTAGTVAAGTGTISRGGTANHNSGSIAWNNWTVTNGTTTLTGNLDVNATLTVASGATLSCGSNQINCAGNFSNAGTFTRATSTVVFDGTSIVVGATSFNLLTFSASSVNLASSANFVAASTFTANGAGANNLIVLTATTAGQRAIFRVSGGQSVSFVSATDIDSSGGNAVSNANGVISNTINWSVPAPPVPSTDTLSYIFMVA